ncbi:LexA family transcriptional regulator [Sutterella wadsworthensis]|uniref:LexA family transcriptional regulator n=1 Tax=Sutterella wadsworthensis TaxID=40545 RepID=UPI003AEFF2FD
MSTLEERLNEAFAQAKESNPKISKSGLARACDVRPSSVTDWFNGRTREMTAINAQKAALYLGVSSAWLSTGKGSMRSSGISVFDEGDALDDNEYVEIPEYSVTCSAGPGCEVIFEEVSDSNPARYRRSWFQSRGINPDHCKRFKVHGDSMEPLLWDGDTILVDCGVKEVLDGKIYAFMIRGSMRVKILHPLLRGGYLVQSLNPGIPDETLDDGDLDAFFLIGRVRDRSGSSMF